MGYIRAHLELHGLYKVIFSMVRAIVVASNEEGQDGFAHGEKEPKNYADDNAFREDDKADEYDEIMDGLKGQNQDQDDDDYLYDDDDDEDE